MDFSEIQRIREEHLRLFGGDSRPLHKHNTRNATKLRNMATEEAEYYQHADAVRSFASSVFAVRCSGCGHRIPIEKGDILPSFGSELNELHACCKSCFAVTCLGCKQMLTTTTARLGNSASNGRHLTWHCDNARTVLIWALLFGYDEQMQRSKHDKLSPTKGSKKRATHLGTAGIGYSGDHDDEYPAYPSGTYEEVAGVAGSQYTVTWNEDTGYPSDVTDSAMKQHRNTPSHLYVDPGDKPTSRLLAALVALFPSPHEQPIPTDFDYQPPSILLSLLTCSSILDKAAELVRNNSLQDVASRAELYGNLSAFVRNLANNRPAMSSMLHKSRPIRKAGHDLSRISYAAPHYEAMDTSHPISHCIRDLVRQSEHLLQNAAQHEDYYLDEGSQQMLLICLNIREVGELLDKTRNLVRQSQAIPEDPYAWQDGLQVVAVPDEQIFSQNHYAKEAQTFSQAARGRMRHLINEVQMLEAGIPRNIFVRYGESRMDVMKVVIAGPVGSPYEHGLFEFDLLCPPEYPQVAPKMFFRTTGGGTVLFNPNLYATGYVCLSLLGTWSGEPWQPGKSTLLQVLVSMQGMVFCEEPWCNEPGRESARGTDLSKQFNRNLWPSVVKYGMLEWIEGNKNPTPPPPNRVHYDPLVSGTPGAPPVMYTPPSPYGQPNATANSQNVDAFTEVAKKYFNANHNNIINTVKLWIKERDRHNTLSPSSQIPPPPPPTYSSLMEGSFGTKPPKKKKKFGSTPEDSWGPASPAIPKPPAKKIDLVSPNATLRQYLRAALEDMNGMPAGQGGPAAWANWH